MVFPYKWFIHLFPKIVVGAAKAAVQDAGKAASTTECLFVDGLFGDVIPSTKECLFVDGLFVDVILSTKGCLFVDGLFPAGTVKQKKEGNLNGHPHIDCM